MTKHSQKSVSFSSQSPTLYELLLSVERPPKPLSVSPATLTSLVGSVIDLLVEQQLSATLLVKFPPGEIWQAEIQRYHKQVNVSEGTYTYNIYTENTEFVNEVSSSEPSGNGFDRPDSPVVPVQLAPTSQLKHEYFLLVLSPQFCSLILAHRPHIRRQAGTRKKTDQKITQPLQAICSFEGRVIQRVLDGIKHELALSESQSIPAEELARYSCLKCNSVPDPVLLSQLLAIQIQQQNQLRGNANAHLDPLVATKALQVQNQELLNTLRLKDDFFSEVCQELRTPLAHMKMALTLLNSPQLKPPQRQRYLQLLNTECDRQNSLINGLLDLMQLDRVAEQTKLEPVRLSDIVPGVVSTYQPLAQEKGIMLAYTVPEELPAVSCLNPWLKPIVINLLHNNIKYTATGGEVWVRSSLQGDYAQL